MLIVMIAYVKIAIAKTYVTVETNVTAQIALRKKELITC